MALTDRVVIEVMRRRDFYHAGTEFHVHVIVGNNWNLAIAQRQCYLLTDQFFITRVVRVHHHRHIPQHGFWASRGHR